MRHLYHCVAKKAFARCDGGLSSVQPFELCIMTRLVRWYSLQTRRSCPYGIEDTENVVVDLIRQLSPGCHVRAQVCSQQQLTSSAHKHSHRSRTIPYKGCHTLCNRSFYPLRALKQLIHHLSLANQVQYPGT